MSSDKLLTLSEAQKLVLIESRTWGKTMLPLEKASGRVLADAVYADRDYPPFNRSAVDGYAFSSKSFKNGTTNLKVQGVIYAGSEEKFLKAGKAVKIMTGAPVPLGADAVIRVEDSEESDALVNFKTDKIRKWQNIALKGEDLLSGEIIMQAGIKLGPAQIASLAATGHTEVSVAKLPRVHIISTGNEIVRCEQKPLPHQIRDSNYYSLFSFLQAYEINSPAYSLIPDEEKQLLSTITEASEDILILSGGVSMGDADFVPFVLEQAGFKKIFHKVAIKPGKPIWFGKKGKQIAFALPGNPVSVQVVWKIFIEPFIRKSMGLTPFEPLILPFMSGRIKKSGFDEFFPCQLEKESFSYVKSVRSNGSGDIRTTSLSDGIALHPAETPELVTGDNVLFYWW